MIVNCNTSKKHTTRINASGLEKKVQNSFPF